MKLLDNEYLEGTGYKELKNELCELSKNTHVIKVQNSELCFLSLCELDKTQIEGKVSFYVLDGAYMENFLSGNKLTVGTIPKAKLNEELEKELVTGNRMMIIAGNTKFLVSQHAMTTLSMRAGVTGDSTVQNHNLYRDMHVAYSILNSDDCTTIVYRTNKAGQAKIFGMMGRYYKMIPQTFLLDIIETIMKSGQYGKVTVPKWSISHEYTDVYLEFPERAHSINEDNIIPGIWISTSDIGSASFGLRLTYRIEGTKNHIIAKEISHKHSKTITLSEVMENIEELLNDMDFVNNMNELSSEIISEIAALDLTEYVFRKLYSQIFRKENKVNALDEIKTNISSFSLYNITKSFLSHEPSNHMARALLIKYKELQSQIPSLLLKQ